MAIEIVMPRLGWTMEEGSLVEWLKKDGETVSPGDIVFTVETDKAINEIESFESGVLRIPPDSPAPGVMVPVGGLLAYLVQPGEAAPFESGGSASPAAAAPPDDVETGLTTPATDVPAAAAIPTPPMSNSNGRGPTISPRARRVAGELGVDWTTLTGSGRTGRIVERDVRAAAEQLAASASARVSPIARKVAGDLNVDLDNLAASMPGKRIERADVERAAAVNAPTAPTPVPTPAPAAVPSVPQAGETRTPISTVRHITSQRMSASSTTTAPVTLTTEVDATELVALRKRLKADADATGQPTPSYNDLLAKLVAEALKEHPTLNSRFDGDDIVQSEAVHVGIAVDTPRGLLVPVMRDVQSKSLRQIARDSAGAIERARTGALGSGEMSGGTFTITNLGMFEIDAFTPIINLPECAILGVGRIVPKPVVVDVEAETVAIRHMLVLSLTFDHRLVDGGPAARFMQALKRAVEHPLLWLL
jgi:pyruvate dehydrogenase E2 component (dihydrolipoamide acetyltransferase)